jgi:sortase A
MKKIMSLILIIIGIFAILSPFIMDRIIENREKISQVITEEITAEQIEENEKQEAFFDYEAIQDVEIRSVIKATVNTEKEKMNENIIGQIIIEDLKINLPILKGITDSNLLIGAATMKSDLVMGQGNYSLAGHYTKNDKFFGRLLEIENGAVVKITNKKTVYEYVIYDTQIVPDTSLYMLDHERADRKGKPTISLMTCYYTSKNGKRFFALGELANQYPYE